MRYFADAMQIIGPLLVALLTFYSVDYLTRAVTWIDNLPAHLKRGIAIAIASVITLAAKGLDIVLPTDLSVWTPDTLDALYGATIAMVAKSGDTAKGAKAEAHAAVAIAVATADKVG